MRRNLIYDIGMHRGEDTAFYLKKGFDVVAVEANEELCRECARNFAEHISSGRLTIINKAIAEHNGTIKFYVNEQLSVWGTANPEWEKRNRLRGAASREVEVESTRLQDILEKYGVPYYMKVDIEGFDFLCLEALIGLDDKPRYVSAESSATSILDTMRQLILLRRLGYTRFKIVPQHNIEEQTCPDPPREGRRAEHAFIQGSSGLFGEETPGEWVSFARLFGKYQRIHLDCRMVGQNNGIFRGLPNSSMKHFLEKLCWRGRGWYDTHATF